MVYNLSLMKSSVKNFKKLKGNLLKVNSGVIAVTGAGLGLVFGAPLILVPGIMGAGFFSWRIFKDDLARLKVVYLNLIGLLVFVLTMWVVDANFAISIPRALITFLIGWVVFQLFEGDVGGGDVRLATVVAVFLNTVQLLSAISLASFVGLLLASFFKLKKIPFGALLIVATWLSFWIVRF